MVSKWNAESEMQCIVRYRYKDGARCDNVLVKLAKVTQWFSNGKTEQTIQKKGLGFFFVCDSDSFYTVIKPIRK